MIPLARTASAQVTPVTFTGTNPWIAHADTDYKHFGLFYPDTSWLAGGNTNDDHFGPIDMTTFCGGGECPDGTYFFAYVSCGPSNICPTMDDHDLRDSAWTDIYQLVFLNHELTGSTISTSNTRIISLNPLDGETIVTSNATTSVDFRLTVYISPDDVGDFFTIKINFRNIDQNTILNGECTNDLDLSLGLCSEFTKTFFSGNATTTGFTGIASSTVLRRGNYRVTASLDTSTSAGGINLGFFGFLGAKSLSLSHQFIVGSSTWIGSQSQNLFSDLDNFFGTLPATTTQANAATCSPLSSSFGVRECIAFLFIPDARQLNSTMQSFRDGFLVRAPWGYVTRFFDILSSSATSSLPMIEYQFDPNGPLAGKTWTIDIGDMVAGASTALNGVTEPINHRTLRDVLEPLVYLIVAMAVIFGIITDLLGSHNSSVHEDRNKRR